MNYYIITGTTRGIGEAIAKQIIAPNNTLICIARHDNAELQRLASERNSCIKYIEFDLTNSTKIDAMMDSIFAELKFNENDSICIINNAGVIQPIATLGNCDSTKMITAVDTNVIAPILIANSFIRNTKNFSGSKLIVNMTSGSGVEPYHGWTAYCTTKAAMCMLTKCVAMEQENESNPVKIISVAPGVIETDMQREIRASKKEDFAALDFFVNLKTKDKVKTADYAAEKIVSLIANNDYESGEFYDFIEL